MLSIPKCLRVLFLLDRFLLSYNMTALKLRTICPCLYFNNEHLIQHKLSKDSLIFQKDIFLLLNNSVNLMGYEIKIYLIIKKKKVVVHFSCFHSICPFPLSLWCFDRIMGRLESGEVRERPTSFVLNPQLYIGLLIKKQVYMYFMCCFFFLIIYFVCLQHILYFLSWTCLRFCLTLKAS